VEEEGGRVVIDDGTEGLGVLQKANVSPTIGTTVVASSTWMLV